MRTNVEELCSEFPLVGETGTSNSPWSGLTWGVNSLACGTEWTPIYKESSGAKTNADLGSLTGRCCKGTWDVDGTPAVPPDFLKPKDLSFHGFGSESTFLLFSSFRTNLDVWTRT